MMTSFISFRTIVPISRYRLIFFRFLKTRTKRKRKTSPLLKAKYKRLSRYYIIARDEKALVKMSYYIYIRVHPVSKIVQVALI